MTETEEIIKVLQAAAQAVVIPHGGDFSILSPAFAAGYAAGQKHTYESIINFLGGKV